MQPRSLPLLAARARIPMRTRKIQTSSFHPLPPEAHSPWPGRRQRNFSWRAVAAEDSFRPTDRRRGFSAPATILRETNLGNTRSQHGGHRALGLQGLGSPINPAVGWNHRSGYERCLYRWASSSAALSDSGSSESETGAGGASTPLESTLEIDQEEADRNATISPRKKKRSRRQKRRESIAGEKLLDVKFLHFWDGGTDAGTETTELLRKDFEKLAFDHDLSKFKWISMLEKALVLKLRKEQEQQQQEPKPGGAGNRSRRKKASNTKPPDRLRDYWKVALRAASNKKKVPEQLREHFLTRMVVPAGGSEGERVDPSPELKPSTGSDDPADAKLLARGRELAVEHPLLWRRYSAKERKHKVRIAREIMAELVEGAAAGEATAATHASHGFPPLNAFATKEMEAMAAAAAKKANHSLDIYLQWIRIPELRRVHAIEKTSVQREDEALQMQQLLAARLPETSYRKVMALVRTYVECFGGEGDSESGAEAEQEGIDGKNDGETLVTLQASPLTTYTSETPHDGNGQPTAKSNKETPTLAKKQKQFRVLLSNLRKILPQGRIHWIGKDVADFFYITTPDAVDLRVAGRNKKIDDSVTPNHQTFSGESIASDNGGRGGGDQRGFLVARDPVLGHSQTSWNEVRDQYVQSFVNVQKLFLELEREREEHRQRRAERLQGDETGDLLREIDEILDGADEKEDTSSEKSVVRTFDVVTALSRLDKKKTTTERVRPREYVPLEAVPMGEHWKTGGTGNQHAATDMDELLVGNLLESKAKLYGETKGEKDNELASETVDLRQPQLLHASSSSEDSFPLAAPVDRMVVVDNLPIDMNEGRLREAYGRCGTIEAVRIFHSRPELDPGRRSTDSTKKIRSPSSSSRRQKWSRPRTPLYAMIVYEDAASAGKAACDPLRIFGMVLDHHLMRSHRASDMNVLYLEDVPTSLHTVSSMEIELSELLRPADLYLCLDDSGHNRLRKLGTGKKKKTYPLSYAIKFPSFEAAYWSYLKLSMELELLRNDEDGSTPSAFATSPSLHWMETPNDAMLYWTRKLNF